MKPLRLVFMGSPDFAVPSLSELHKSVHEITAVVSHPDKRRGRGSQKSPTPVKKKALELELPVIEVNDVNSEVFTAKIRELDPDLIVVVAFRILPPAILNIPSIGSVNVHASLLPKYRGAAPIHWAVIKGEKETGCTIFMLDNKVDTGDIIAQKRILIGENETTGDIYNKLKITGAKLLAKTLNDISAGTYKRMEQNHKKASPAPKLFKENTKIDFNQPAIDVHNKIRGLSPMPTAWTLYRGEKMNLYESRLHENESLAPGKMEFKNGKLLVGCSVGAVELNLIQLPGSKRLTGEEFSNGYDISCHLG